MSGRGTATTDPNEISNDEDITMSSEFRTTLWTQCRNDDKKTLSLSLQKHILTAAAPHLNRETLSIIDAFLTLHSKGSPCRDLHASALAGTNTNEEPTQSNASDATTFRSV